MKLRDVIFDKSEGKKPDPRETHQACVGEHVVLEGIRYRKAIERHGVPIPFWRVSESAPGEAFFLRI